MKTGICIKCGHQGKVVMHHTKGYDGVNKDFVLPYCVLCHQNVHRNARKTGRCQIPTEEIERLSNNSGQRRRQKENCKLIHFYDTPMKYIQFVETIQVWPNRIQYTSYFQGSNGKKVFEVEI